MLPPADLNSIRNDILTLLPNTGQIMSVTGSSDGQGGYTEAWGTATANVAYRLDPLRGSEQVTGGAVQPYHSFVLTLPYNTTITTNNRFKAEDGQLYAITSVDGGKSWQASVRVYVEKV